MPNDEKTSMDSPSSEQKITIMITPDIYNTIHTLLIQYDSILLDRHQAILNVFMALKNEPA
jgi:hypothetical protein